MSFASIIRSLKGLPPAPPEAFAPPATVYAYRAGDAGGDGPVGEWQDVIRRLQRRRNSHVIGLIHRHLDPREDPETWYFDATIGDNHTQDFLTALRAVPPGDRLDVVLHAAGAFPGALQQIARAIKGHKGETTVFVPYYAHDLSTLIALAADHIVLGSSAVLSYAEFEDLQAVLRQKGAKRVDDFTIILMHVWRMYQRELREFACELTHGGTHGEGCALARKMIGSERSISNPISAAEAARMGLPVTTQTPDEVFELIAACRAAPMRDHGVKSVRQAAAAPRYATAPLEMLRQLPAHSRIFPPQWPAPRLRGFAPHPVRHLLSDDEEDEGSDGVAAENCDVTVRPLIAKIEAARKSRVVCIIHQPGMESTRLDRVTTEDVLAAIHATPADMPLDILLHTPGGYAFDAKQIASAVKAHRGRKTVLVPYFAMSGGTIIALAADQIAMSQHATLGPVDLQLGGIPMRAILFLVETKPARHIQDAFVAIARHARRDIAQSHQDALDLMRGVYSPGAANRIAHTLNDGRLTHGYPVTPSAAAALGLHVSEAMPSEAFDIVRAFRHNRLGKRSVVYCV